MYIAKSKKSQHIEYVSEKPVEETDFVENYAFIN